MLDVDAPRIQALGLAGVSDERVLALAASENRVVLTHDVSTLVASAYRRVEAAEAMPGVNVFRDLNRIPHAMELRSPVQSFPEEIR